MDGGVFKKQNNALKTLGFQRIIDDSRIKGGYFMNFWVVVPLVTT